MKVQNISESDGKVLGYFSQVLLIFRCQVQVLEMSNQVQVPSTSTYTCPMGHVCYILQKMGHNYDPIIILYFLPKLKVQNLDVWFNF